MGQVSKFQTKKCKFSFPCYLIFYSKTMLSILFSNKKVLYKGRKKLTIKALFRFIMIANLTFNVISTIFHVGIAFTI